MRLNIFPTFRCSRRCEGCYSPRTGKVMRGEDIYHLIEWLKKKAPEYKNLKLHFLGGEPLLAPWVVLSVIDLAKKIDNFVPDRTLIFTNGDFISRELLKMLKERKAKIVLNPVDDLKRVESKMKQITEIMGGVSLSVPLNSWNLERLSDITKLSIKYKAHIRFNRLYQEAGNISYQHRYVIEMSKALDLLINAKDPIWPNFIVDAIYTDAEEGEYACGKSLYVVDPGGIVRSCTADMNSKIGILGDKEFKHIQRWEASNYKKCLGCEWYNWCQGGCPYTSKLVYGRWDMPTPFCEAYKQIFPKLLQLVIKWNKHYGS